MAGAVFWVLLRIALAQEPDWSSVCTLERRRGIAHVESQRWVARPERRGGFVSNSTGVLRLYVDGVLTLPVRPVPRSVVNGTPVVVRLEASAFAFFEDAIFVDLAVSPERASCKRALRWQRVELGTRLEMSEMRTSRQLRSSRSRWVKRMAQVSAETRAVYGGYPPPPEAVWDQPASRAVLHAVACGPDSKSLDIIKVELRIVPSISSALRAKACRRARRPAPLPPPNDPTLLERVLETGARDEVARATRRLAESLARRGILCDRVVADHLRDPEGCAATVLDECPACGRASGDDASPDCLFASSAAVEVTSPKVCVRVCIAVTAWRHIWAADKSRGKDARDDNAKPCRVVHVHALAAWVRTRRDLAPFVAKDNFETDGLTQKWVGHQDDLAATFPDTSPLGPKQLRRCAVVGSGHTLRCALVPWGSAIDSPRYDAVFRVNKAQFQPRARAVHICQTGVRTDFIVNAFSGENPAIPLTLPSRWLVRGLAALGGAAIAKSPTDYRDHTQALTKFHKSPLAAVSAYRFAVKSLDVPKIARDRLPPHSVPRVYLPTRQVSSRALGSGSGSTALGVALAACTHVDAFAFGVFRGNASHDFRYMHFYQATPSEEDSSGGGAQVLNSEIRNHIFDAFGVANFIWW
ncbi:hypothetical protein CTAYLR_006100 [Chrysophaeum taylorii]|uniref:Uncharacterized protein n=1 Tax=Chrysophaeum taylorii TaxID=2483200 RepID=A0AAD7XGP3_9STRA|nr:hypothetical protein CTAYLR_006100 [Chrysophaeum taylorii]